MTKTVQQVYLREQHHLSQKTVGSHELQAVCYPTPRASYKRGKISLQILAKVFPPPS